MPYLLKALYWLFLITKVFYIHKSPASSRQIDQIKEEDEDAVSNDEDEERLLAEVYQDSLQH